MLIDADVHISPFQEGLRITAEELLERMDRSEVDKALAWLQPHYFRDVEVGNRYIYDSARKFSDRILGFGWTDPHHGVDKAIETVHRCIDEYGFYGVKLNGAQNEYYIDSEDFAMPVIEAIAKTGKILAFHIGTDAYEATHPFRLGKIAARFPETQILSIHMGGVASNDLTNAMIEIAQGYQNITLIGSAVKTSAILKGIKILGADRVCFGSDTPFNLMRVELARYNAMLDGEVTEEEKTLIMGGNIARLFRLDG